MTQMESHNHSEEPSSPLSQDQYVDDSLEQANNDIESGDHNNGDNVTIRSLLSTKGAGVVIGKAGKTVEQLREETGVKAGISKVVQGVNDRVLTISGTVDQVHKAYAFIARTLLETPIQYNVELPPDTTLIRLLISHTLMGSIIGRQGSKIKEIQENTGVKLVANKEMLPQSTERIVEIQGTPESIGAAVHEIAKSLRQDWERGSQNTVYYDPKVRVATYNRGSRYQSQGGYSQGGFQQQGGYYGGYRQNNNYDDGQPQRFRRTGRGDDFTRVQRPSYNGSSPSQSMDPNLETRTFPIPSDMVGCIIGKGGSKISEIRNKSKCRISIAKEPNENGERLFTMIGTPESNDKALELLLSQLELENNKRQVQGEESGSEQ